METIKLLINKLSQYNFLTNIIPGTVLCIILKYFVGYNLIPEDYYLAGIVFYFVGMINSRVGSLIVEPFLKWIKWIVFAPYKDFITAEKQDEKVVVLNQENNVYRSYLSAVFISMIALLYKNTLTVYHFVQDNEIWILLGLLTILFLLSYRKQTQYVKKRVEANIKKKDNDE